jgi:hypothetical protein
MAHAYSAEMIDRTKAIRLSSVAGVVVFALIGVAIQASGWRPPFWITTPSAAAIFGLVFTAYDRQLWRRKIHRTRLSAVPNLAGTWVGEITIAGGPTRPEEVTGPHDPPEVRCHVFIDQTWSKISVKFETHFTTSESAMASITADTLSYEYTVEPKVGARYPETVHRHSGMASLRFEYKAGSTTEIKEMHGHFYNDQHYHRYGKYELRRDKTEMAARAWIPQPSHLEDHARSSDARDALGAEAGPGAKRDDSAEH